MKKFYAVKNGRNKGIFLSWEECEKQVKGYNNAVFKGFNTIEEAKNYLLEDNYSKNQIKTLNDKKIINLINDSNKNKDFGEVYAFVDGSFNAKNNVYGYGGFLIVNNKEYILKGSFSDSEGIKMRNVAGEIEGAIAAVKKAKELNMKKLIIYYDYKGIELWASGEWKRNKKRTKAYYEFMQENMNFMDISFKKVTAHSNMEENDRADMLAKEAVGIL